MNNENNAPPLVGGGVALAGLIRPRIAVPIGGFSTDEAEALWLTQTIELRIKEGLGALGIKVAPSFKSLDMLLLISLGAAGRRAAKRAQALASTDSATLIEALVAIARGRPDNGRPLGGETGRSIARAALVEIGRDWNLSPEA